MSRGIEPANAASPAINADPSASRRSAQKAVAGVDCQGRPDESEVNGAGWWKRFAEQEHAEGELHGRGDVLRDPHRRIRDSPSAKREKGQWDGGDQASGQQPRAA